MKRFTELLNENVCNVGKIEPLNHCLGAKMEYQKGKHLKMTEIERIEILYEKFKDHVPASIGKTRPDSPMRSDRRPDPVVDSPQTDAERKLMENLPFRSLLQAMMQMTTCMSMKTCLNLISRCQSMHMHTP